MWLGSPQQLEKVNVSETARDLSVIVDSQLTLSAQVFAVCCSGYYQLRQLRPLVRSMSSDAVKTLVQAFISCHLDYCNSMFYGITNGLMSRLWSVQNEELHWLVFGVGWISRWSPWSIWHCPAWLQHTWPLTVSWSLTKVVVSCRQMDLQQLWRQILCCCRSEAVEQTSNPSETN